MIVLRRRVRVGPDGNVTIPVGIEEAGSEVDVVVTSELPLTREEYLDVIERTAGIITDPTFVRPPQWDVRTREPLD